MTWPLDKSNTTGRAEHGQAGRGRAAFNDRAFETRAQSADIPASVMDQVWNAGTASMAFQDSRELLAVVISDDDMMS